MPTYTHQANGRGRRVPLSASTADAAGPYGWRDDCPVHGIHTDLNLDPEDLQVETAGMEWRLKDRYSVSMCGGCASEYREREIVCEQHGRLTLTVRQLEEAMAHA